MHFNARAEQENAAREAVVAKGKRCLTICALDCIVESGCDRMVSTGGKAHCDNAIGLEQFQCIFDALFGKDIIVHTHERGCVQGAARV
ncbi:MAG: hypothetical protein BWY75_03530 [bacterium ADurb.Bin425]|nr:MAG: hypothetical protein BWY75_03530 [bacterium ADurb.Bin425]